MSLRHRGLNPIISLTVQLTESGSETQSYTVLLPRTTGLGTSFRVLRDILALKTHLVDTERIGDPRVDGMLVPLRATPEQYGVGEGETIEFHLRKPTREVGVGPGRFAED